jgi:hypothetical protein
LEQVISHFNIRNIQNKYYFNLLLHLTLRMEYRLGIFDNTVLRRTCGPKETMSLLRRVVVSIKPDSIPGQLIWDLWWA